MAVTLTCTKIIVEPTRILINWSDGAQHEFSSKQEFKDAMGTVDDDPGVVRKLLMCKWIKANPALSNPALVEGKTITFNIAATPVVQIN